ncbi:unnamed protein product, partial [Ixodes pacificus]
LQPLLESHCLGGCPRLLLQGHDAGGHQGGRRHSPRAATGGQRHRGHRAPLLLLLGGLLQHGVQLHLRRGAHCRRPAHRAAGRHRTRHLRAERPSTLWDCRYVTGNPNEQLRSLTR